MITVQGPQTSGRAGIGTWGGSPAFYHSPMKLPPLTLHKLSASTPPHSTPHSYLHIDSESSCCSHGLMNQIYWKQLQSLHSSVKTLKSYTIKSQPDVIDPPRTATQAPSGVERSAEESSLCFESPHSCLSKLKIPI